MYERRRGETGPHIDFVSKQPRWDSAHHERLPKGVTPDPKPGPTLTPTLTPAPLPAVSLASQSMLKPSSSLKPSDSPAAGGQLLAGECSTPMSACSHYNLVSALHLSTGTTAQVTQCLIQAPGLAATSICTVACCYQLLWRLGSPWAGRGADGTRGPLSYNKPMFPDMWLTGIPVSGALVKCHTVAPSERRSLLLH